MLFSSGWRRVRLVRVISGYASASIFQITKTQWMESAIDGGFDLRGYAHLIKECGDLKALARGKRVHEHLVRSGLELSTHVGNLLIDMYRKCTSLQDARRTFEMMKDRDVVSWTTMIMAYSQHGFRRQALDLFALMQRQGFKPNKVTFLSILSTCSDPQFIEDGKKIQALMAADGLLSDAVIATALMSMYSRCQSVEDAWRVFEKMPKRDAVSWTVIITAFAQGGLVVRALELFAQMRKERVEPDNITLASILNACTKAKALEQGKYIHRQIRGSRLELDVVVGNALINLYGRSKDAQESNRLFNQLPVRSLISWNSLIAAFCHDWNGEEALQLCAKMQWEGFYPDLVTCVSLLDACGTLGLLEEGTMIHKYVKQMGWERDVVLGTALMRMYSKWGSLDDANMVFQSLSDRDVVTWNAIIAAHAQHGKGKEALQLFQSMQREGVDPDDFTFVSLLDACASPRLLAEGRLIHTLIIQNRLKTDVVIGNALVNMYGKAGDVDCARRAFNNMEIRDTISWNAMIAAYAQQGHGREALQVFKEMVQVGSKPDNITYLSVLDACASAADLVEGKLIHASIMKSEFSTHISLENAILDMYGKCGYLEGAFNAFYSMGSRDSVSWNTLINTCAQHGCGNLALQAFGQMAWEGVKVNDLTMIGVLTACNHAGQTEEGCHYFVSPDYRRNNSFAELFGYIGGLLGKAK